MGLFLTADLTAAVAAAGLVGEVVVATAIIFSDSFICTGKSLSEAQLFVGHGENMLCTKIILKRKFFTQHVLPRFELGIFDRELALAVLYVCFCLLVVVLVLLPFLNFQAQI